MPRGLALGLRARHAARLRRDALARIHSSSAAGAESRIASHSGASSDATCTRKNAVGTRLATAGSAAKKALRAPHARKAHRKMTFWPVTTRVTLDCAARESSATSATSAYKKESVYATSAKAAGTEAIQRGAAAAQAEWQRRQARSARVHGALSQ